MSDRSRTYVPVLATGVAAAGLTALAGSRNLATIEGSRPTLGQGATAVDSGIATLPLATALSMVVLASWGVLLVTRGLARRVVGVLGALAALGVLATVVAGWRIVQDGLRDDPAVAAAAAATSIETHVTWWWWVALASAAISAGASAAALALVGSWPEMGTRYDTPTGRTPPVADDDLALWKALDEGRDPTAGESR